MTKMEGEMNFEELKILRELTYEKLKKENMVWQMIHSGFFHVFRIFIWSLPKFVFLSSV